jgi:hypothetical protein
MDHLDYLERVRRFVRSTFEELGGPVMTVEETVLLRGDHYCGRRFRSGPLVAVWFSDENELKFYADNGGVTRVFRPAVVVEHTYQQRAA